MDRNRLIFVMFGFFIINLPINIAFGDGSWQLNRLIQPQKEHLNQEAKGLVFIYDVLFERDVETALNTNFGRIDNMMFIRTKVIVEGEVEETDDCD